MTWEQFNGVVLLASADIIMVCAVVLIVSLAGVAAKIAWDLVFD